MGFLSGYSGGPATDSHRLPNCFAGNKPAKPVITIVESWKFRTRFPFQANGLDLCLISPPTITISALERTFQPLNGQFLLLDLNFAESIVHSM